MNAHMRMCTRTHNLPLPSGTAAPSNSRPHKRSPSHYHSLHYCTCFGGWLFFFPPIIHFFVSIFIRDYVLRYGNACDYYSLCGFMILSLLNLCAYVHVCVCACVSQRGGSLIQKA